MPRSERTLLKERLRQILSPGSRQTDFAFRLRVYRRGPDGTAQPAELLPTVYGARYDRLLRTYLPDPPEHIGELKVHPEQLRVLTLNRTGLIRIMALGAPGSGKSFTVVAWAALRAAQRPNSVAGIVSPTSDRRDIVWQDFHDVLGPLGWIQDASKYERVMRLVNGTVLEFRAAKSAGQGLGSPLQGRSWDWAAVDETQSIDDKGHQEIAARGRRDAKHYIVFESGTNDPIPSFQNRVDHYEAHPDRFEVIRFDPLLNPWVDPINWANLKLQMSDREYDARVLCKRVPSERRVYGRFGYKTHVADGGALKRPPANRDITAAVIRERYNDKIGRSILIGQDFGALVTCSVVLKCFAGPGGPRDRQWWVIDEITSYGEYSDKHARKLRQKYDPSEMLVVADPAVNTKDGDRSDYTLFRNEGLDVVRAADPTRLTKRARIAMVNSLFEDATGTRRLFIDADSGGATVAPKLVNGLRAQEYDDQGNPETGRKNYSDTTHWPCALGYGLYPFEFIRATETPPSPSPTRPPWER